MSELIICGICFACGFLPTAILLTIVNLKMEKEHRDDIE